jgi:hypothetical protein
MRLASGDQGAGSDLQATEDEMQLAEERQALPPTAWRAIAVGALAVGAAAIGALAIGFLAIGRLGIGRLSVRNGKFGLLAVDDLTVQRLTVRDLVMEGADSDA